jgi:hypothetical protein
MFPQPRNAFSSQTAKSCTETEKENITGARKRKSKTREKSKKGECARENTPNSDDEEKERRKQEKKNVIVHQVHSVPFHPLFHIPIHSDPQRRGIPKRPNQE